MSDLDKLDPKTTVVLSLDCQNGVIDFVPDAVRIFKPAARVLEGARARGLRVVHVGIGFSAGYPEVQPTHPMFKRVTETGRFIRGSASTELHPELGARPGELFIYKHRVSAFSGNSLEMILRSQGLSTLVLFGIATSGIVLSTVRQASDLDFRCVVVKDCCADGDEEVHRVLTEKVFPRQAAVFDSETLLG